MPVKVQVVATVTGPWTTALSEKKHKKWLHEQQKHLEHEVHKELKHTLTEKQCAKQFARVVEGGNQAVALNQAATDFAADIVLLGSKSVRSNYRFRPTSLADDMMHSCPIPLGLAPKELHLSKKGITRITFALLDKGDGTTSKSFSGLGHASTLACTLGVPLRIVAFSPLDEPERALEWNETALAALDKARDKAFAVAAEHEVEELDVSSEVAAGDGWKEAMDTVHWKKGDLLCMGSQQSEQLRQLRRVFVGTREGEFVRFAPVPVLIYPRGRKEGEK